MAKGTVRNYRFISNRILKNSRGEEKGRMAVRVKAGSDMAEVIYTCPECGHSERTEQPWKRPFSVKCSKCGSLMRLPKLKDEIKKEKKAAKA
jgi:RNase P subunit RPR2